MIDAVESEKLTPQNLKRVPTKTGCYIFKGKYGANEEGRVLYVGKAKNLRDRVRTYFTEKGDGRTFVKFIKEKTTLIEYFIAKDEQDALLLENELIKRYKPPYNIHLKDDRRYLSLRLDLKHEWPMIQVTRKVKKDQAVYLGPFSSATRLRETLNTIQKIFPLRSCPDSKLYNRSRPCIEYDIKRCVAPCVNYVSKEDYDGLVESTVRFLKGDSDELIGDLKKKMDECAEAEEYEEAAKLRDRIEAVENVTQSKASVISHKNKDRDLDVVGVASDGTKAIVYLLFVRNGNVWDGKSFEFNQLRIDQTELTHQFLAQYYSSDVYIPHEVLVPEDMEVVGLQEKVKFVVPRLKEKKYFQEMAQRNAEAKLRDQIEQKEKLGAILETLHKKLKLSKVPQHIDCIDISHQHGTDVVASVVRFSEGLPNKSFYRKIKLKTQKIDDFESMKEAIQRRYREGKDLPDVLMVDGGKGQLSSALEALKAAGLDTKLELISLAKARSGFDEIDPLNPKNRERIFKPGRMNPILLKEESPEELMLSYLRDEAHRFAITYHRKKKVESISSSVLDEVKGLGSRQKLKLLKEFGSIERIREASDAELLNVINRKALANLRAVIEDEF